LAVLLALLAGCSGPSVRQDCEPAPQQRFLRTGATGPGIDYTHPYPLLNGAFAPATGWPFVLRDHFVPRPERIANLWVVRVDECPQELGSDPWSCVKVLHFDTAGNLVPCDPNLLLAQVRCRPTVIEVQGHMTTLDLAVGGLLWTHSWLDRHGALPPDAVLVAFHWRSERALTSDLREVNDAGRRAFVGAFHLARLLQAWPPQSRVCLLGHSYGGRIVPATLHLLGGGALKGGRSGPAVALEGGRPDLHLRAVIIAAGADHTWLDPGERLDRALTACECFLNLYNSCDRVQKWYPLLSSGDHHRSLGHVGLLPKDRDRLGDLAARYEEHDLNDILGNEHALLPALADPQVARWIAPYVWARR
jgi:hypothetical protein